ncbi:MAG TPA: BMP family ABC transporter substrate-binding protein [Acidimicrobiia bacterium]|nr:BMP family ABC transporter substrate-binding protein [Acidimicrobiia bacterium]
MNLTNPRWAQRWLPAMVMPLVLAACAGGTGDTTTTSEAEAPETTAPTTETTAGPGTTAAPDGQEYRVALIYPGTADDLSWSNAWFDGAEQAMEANPNITVESVELLNDPAAVVQQGSAFASEGYDLILIAHGAMVEPALTLAQQFPDVQICLAPYNPAEGEEWPANLCWVDVAQHNANFFAGALAAMVTETGHIASLNGFAFPALTRQPEAFHLGARCVDPGITFTQQYIETWTDTGISKSAAQAEIAGGADVLLSATDSAVFGILEAAAEADTQVWTVPSYYESQSLDPDHVMTSAVHGLTFASQAIIEAGTAGEIGESAFIDFDATNNPEINAPLYDIVRALLTADDLAQYEDIVSRVRSGDITIPDETTGDPTIGTEGSGGEIDPASIGCG